MAGSNLRLVFYVITDVTMYTDPTQTSFLIQVLKARGRNRVAPLMVAEVAQTTSWRQLWDIALDRGVKGTLGLQRLLRELGRPIFANSVSTLCNADIDEHSLWFEHLCCQQPDVVNNKSVRELNQEAIFAVANSNLNICSLSY